MIINGVQAIELPKEGTKVEFKSLNKTIPVPFVIYADLEALLIELHNKNEKKNDKKSYTLKTHEHKTCSYGYKVVCHENDKYSKPFKMYRGKDAIYKFFEDLFEEEKQIDQYMREFEKTKTILTKDDKNEYNHAKVCYVCNESFTQENYKVKDHCHVTGKFRGPACNSCNLQLKLTQTIPEFSTI
jgi:Recombination endonuclease VII